MSALETKASCCVFCNHGKYRKKPYSSWAPSRVSDLNFQLFDLRSCGHACCQPCAIVNGNKVADSLWGHFTATPFTVVVTCPWCSVESVIGSELTGSTSYDLSSSFSTSASSASYTDSSDFDASSSSDTESCAGRASHSPFTDARRTAPANVYNLTSIKHLVRPPNTPLMSTIQLPQPVRQSTKNAVFAAPASPTCCLTNNSPKPPCRADDVARIDSDAAARQQLVAGETPERDAIVAEEDAARTALNAAEADDVARIDSDAAARQQLLAAETPERDAIVAEEDAARTALNAAEADDVARIDSDAAARQQLVAAETPERDAIVAEEDAARTALNAAEADDVARIDSDAAARQQLVAAETPERSAIVAEEDISRIASDVESSKVASGVCCDEELFGVQLQSRSSSALSREGGRLAEDSKNQISDVSDISDCTPPRTASPTETLSPVTPFPRNDELTMLVGALERKALPEVRNKITSGKGSVNYKSHLAEHENQIVEFLHLMRYSESEGDHSPYRYQRVQRAYELLDVPEETEALVAANSPSLRGRNVSRSTERSRREIALDKSSPFVYMSRPTLGAAVVNANNAMFIKDTARRRNKNNEEDIYRPLFVSSVRKARSEEYSFQEDSVAVRNDNSYHPKSNPRPFEKSLSHGRTKIESPVEIAPKLHVGQLGLPAARVSVQQRKPNAPTLVKRPPTTATSRIDGQSQLQRTDSNGFPAQLTTARNLRVSPFRDSPTAPPPRTWSFEQPKHTNPAVAFTEAASAPTKRSPTKNRQLLNKKRSSVFYT